MIFGNGEWGNFLVIFKGDLREHRIFVKILSLRGKREPFAIPNSQFGSPQKEERERSILAKRLKIEIHPDLLP